MSITKNDYGVIYNNANPLVKNLNSIINTERSQGNKHTKANSKVSIKSIITTGKLQKIEDNRVTKRNRWIKNIYDIENYLSSRQAIPVTPKMENGFIFQNMAIKNAIIKDLSRGVDTNSRRRGVSDFEVNLRNKNGSTKAR